MCISITFLIIPSALTITDTVVPYFFRFLFPGIIIIINLLILVVWIFRWSLMIFIIKAFWTIVFIVIVISPMFWPICPPAFVRFLSNSGTYTELRTTSFTEFSGVEQATPVNSIKDGGHIVRNVVEITIKMKTMVRKPLMIIYWCVYFELFT